MRQPTAFAATYWLITCVFAQFNNPPGVDIWCGKAYKPENSSFDPGGWFEEPPVSEEPLLRLYARPRMSYYLDTDSSATILVDAAIVHQVGEPFPDDYVLEDQLSSSAALEIEVLFADSVIAQSTLKLGSIGNEVKIDLEMFDLSPEPQMVTVVAKLGEDTTYQATAEVFRYQYPETHGSIVRLDSLYGGISAQRGRSASWQRIFPYSYYSKLPLHPTRPLTTDLFLAQWTLYWNQDGGAAEGNPDVDTLNEFQAMGYNVVHIVPTGSLGNTPFPWNGLMPYIERADELGIYLRYDVVWHGGDNLTRTLEQVETLKEHPSILTWYLADEPDGPGRDFGLAQEAYRSIRAIDPFHPVSLVLNCWDFYYEEYSKAADIVSSDVYNIAINATYSEVYHTICNMTYGDCGCDDCEGNFNDVSSRVDEFYRRDELLLWEKAQWTVPQAFGNETFWSRYPTASELVVQTVVGINHGSKGIIQWNYNDLLPEELEAVTQEMARAFTGDLFGDFVLGAPIDKNLHVEGSVMVDATAWVDAETGRALLSVVNKSYDSINSSIEVELPVYFNPKSFEEVIWGATNWALHKNTITISGLKGLEVSIFVLAS